MDGQDIQDNHFEILFILSIPVKIICIFSKEIRYNTSGFLTMSNKAHNVAAGISAILLGLGFREYGWDRLHGFPVPRETGTLVIIVGFIFILFGIFRKDRSDSNKK